LLRRGRQGDGYKGAGYRGVAATTLVAIVSALII
jgi:hypothetical protein